MPSENEFLRVCRELIDPPIIVVDVGAAGHFHDLARLAPLCVLHTFEARANTVGQHYPFGTIINHDVALAGADGERTLHLTKNRLASSMLRPNAKVVRRWIDETSLDVETAITIRCTTLDAIAQHATGLQQIDYLKLDTQGTELEILRGGADSIRRTSIIRTEVEFVELYEGQPLFDNVVRELSDAGFHFVDFTQGETHEGKRIWADALFVRRQLERRQLLRAAAILVELGYAGEARWAMVEAEIDPQIIATLTGKRSVEPRIRPLPRTARNLLRVLRQPRSIVPFLTRQPVRF